MDDKGAETYPDIGTIGMINIKDVNSHVYVQSYPVPLAHSRCHPNMQHYQTALRNAFIEFGLPLHIQADHGSNFHENYTKSPFPTILHLWLVGLGISLSFARIYRPTDQAQVERSHDIIHDQVQQTLPFTSFDAFFQHIEQRRLRLNRDLPNTTLGQPPFTVFPSARHSGRPYSVLQEQSLFAISRIHEYLQTLEWYRKVASNKTISLGSQVYYIKTATPNTELHITFDAKDASLSFFYQKQLIYKTPIKGIQYKELINPQFLEAIKTHQLAFDFPRQNAKK
jgi:hypothetical protein